MAISALKKKLDTIFSLYIRLRDSNEFGIVRCFTCWVEKNYKEGMQNGHFMSRKSYSTRWDEENCAPQCYGCNVMQQGQQFLFSKYIDEKYGEGYSQVLLIKSKQTAKFADFELQEMIDNYTKALKDLENSM